MPSRPFAPFLPIGTKNEEAQTRAPAGACLGLWTGVRWPEGGSGAGPSFLDHNLDKWSTMARAPILVAHDPHLHL
jgi:hypothetical protein